MVLQTKLALSPLKKPIDYHTRTMLVGSCFVGHIAEKLTYYKLPALSNPFGILFHPETIAQFFKAVLDERIFSKTDLVYSHGRWHSLAAHSALSSTDPESVVANLNTATTKAKEYLETASSVIITLGTAWGYRHKRTGAIAANCHKLPQADFEKELAGIREIVDSLQRLVKNVSLVNKDVSVIFTVSPVRHLKDGFVENQRSKAHLIAAVHEVVEGLESTYYFPSYELMMDELRDYRFYDRDMLHPNAVAVDYIWERFAEVALSPKAKKYAEQVGEIQKALHHRPIAPESEQHKKFLTALERKKENLLKELPFLRFWQSKIIGIMKNCF